MSNQAEVATATGAALDATTLIDANANVATSTGEAGQPAASVAPSAGLASATGLANDATTLLTSNASPEAPTQSGDCQERPHCLPSVALRPGPVRWQSAR